MDSIEQLMKTKFCSIESKVVSCLKTNCKVFGFSNHETVSDPSCSDINCNVEYNKEKEKTKVD